MSTLTTEIKSIHHKEPEIVRAEAADRTVRESLRRKCALRLSFTNAFFSIGRGGGLVLSESGGDKSI